MGFVRIRTTVDQSTWDDLKTLAADSQQTLSGLLTEAIREYVQRHRVRPQVLAHLDDSMRENEQLGRLLAL